MAARNAPDDHQVFIGNLPNGVKDAEVRDVFSSKYNNVIFLIGQETKQHFVMQKRFLI